MQIIQASSPNYATGRGGRKPIAIVEHKTAGKYPGCLTWLRNPDAKASAHYLVTRAGEIHQLVNDQDTAWHAGRVEKPTWALYDGTNPNRYTIGIEHEDYDGDGEIGLTEAQYQATLWLHRQLVEQHQIPVDADHIIGHYRIDGVNRPNDPGPGFPWQRLFADLKSGDKVEGKKPAKVIIKGKEFPAYLKDGVSYFQDAPVREVMEAMNNGISWDEKTMTARIE